MSKKCVVCAETKQDEHQDGMCADCGGEADGKIEFHYYTPTAIAWAARRARLFERRRQAKRRGKP